MKEALWDDIKETFRGIDEKRKKALISRAGELHRQWRSRLRDQAKDKNGNYSMEPPPLYAHMSTVAPYWKEFVEMSLKEDFLEKSKKNRERAEAMDARYRKACLGYARIREIIIADKIKAGQTNPVVTRLDAWEYSRQNANGVVDDPVSLQILEDVVEISNQLSEQELTNIGMDDLLARLIPLEYPGRVRALGWGVTKTSLQAATSVSELSKLKNDISFLKNEIMELKRKGSNPGVQSGGSSHMDNFGMDDDFDGDHDDNNDDILSEELPEGKNACYLYLEPGRRYVGRGIIWNSIDDRMLHSVPLEEGYVKVQFEVAEPAEFNTLLPRPCDDITLVGEAPGYFLAWPRKLVSMKLEKPSKIKNNENGKNAKAQEMFKNKKEKAVESVAAVCSRQLGYPLTQDVSHDGVVEMVRLTVILDRVSDVEIEMGPFWDGGPWTEHLNKENVLEVLNEQWLSASSLTFYIRYLCEVYLSKNPDLAAKFSFVSPHIVCHLVDISEASTNLAKFMLGYVDKEHLLLVPYNVSEHWILIGINTKTESIYFMDPAPKTTIVKYKNLKRLVETALVSFRTGSGKTYTKTAFNTFKWTNILFTSSIRLMCYGQDKMTRFRDNWAGFLYNRYLKGKLLNM